MDAGESQNPGHSVVLSALYGWMYVVFSSVAAIVSYLRGGSFHLEALPVSQPEIINEGLEECSHVVTDGNASFLRAARAGNLEKVLDYLKGSIDINTSNANGLNALHLAAKEGHVNVVSELLKRGANVNATTKKGNSALHIASLAGQEEVVKLLVQKQANVNVQSQNGFTPLYMAAQENHDGVVRFLLANGANQSLATEDGFTPLAVALQQGHDKVVAVLLENDARGKVRLPALHIASKKDDCKAAALLLHSEHNPDVTSKSGFTPLHIAAHYGNSNIASLLLEKGADVNFPAKHQITPLHVAAKWGKSNMVKLLLEKGAKIDASTRDGLTPLHCAARSGHDQVVEQLLEKNAPITAKTKNGLAPLHMASQGDHVDSARILLYHKAPVDDVTVDYLTALHVAAHCGHVGVAKLLLDRRADPNARALNGFTPLHIACKKNRIKVVELLLKHGASIEATTESGLTPLHVASFMGCMNIVIYLIQHGANPDIPTVRGETPLHLAARANQTDIIRILLRNGAHVDAKARELQTALHIASRLGNADMVGLLLQHGAAVDAPTKDAYTPLHVAAREGQDEVAALLLDHGAALAAPTKKGFTPLHLAAKYGNLKVAQLLLQKDAPVDAQGKNGVTPLHVAAHYDHVNVALLLLEKGASPHSAARNGYTPLHVAARKDQMDIASSLLEYGAKPGAESRAGFTPLHLAAQEGHADLAALLVEHGADCDAKAKNGLTPMHLCAQEDRVEVATILAKHGASLDPTTKAGYTPLHVACHFGQTNMIRFLLRQGANVNATTSHGYTPLHQAAQQGHTLIINLLLEHRAAPNAITNQGQTALAIAQRLGYISVVETLKVVTETIVTTTTTTVTEEKYRVVAPETMHETFMSDSEDEAAEDNMLGDQSFRYLTADEMKSLGDDSLPIDVTRDERITESIHITREPGHSAPLTQEEERLSPTQAHTTEAVFVGNYAPDNVDLSRTPIHAGSLLSWDGDSCSSAYVLSPTKRMWRESSKLKWKTFLVSFMVDARGGAMRGCRHSGVRVIIPPRKAQMPMRITCRYLRKEKLPHPPPLLEGEACASRILEVGPAGAKFLGPVILEVPHFASLRGKEREISILRSDNGETWKEHTLEASEEAVQEVLNESFEGEELSALEDLQTNRIVRILTTDFPQYFAVVSRTRQEVHAVGPEGGLLSSTVVPQVQAIFPEGALTKKIRVGLQAQPIPAELVTKLLGHRVAVSPIVTVEPRRRKFHKPITLTIPVPQAATKGMINQYAGDAPTLRLLCSITASRRHGQLTGEYRLEAGGTNKAQWEDVTGSTPLTFVNDCVSFTTTVSARFWLMDCRQVSEATKFATELYAEAMHVPFMAKFVVFAKRLDPMEAQLRVFCMTDDKEDKTLESQEHFTEVAKSRDVEVLEKKSQYLEFGGNLVPVTKSGEQLQLQFQAFRENRLPFSVRVKDPHQEPLGRLAFMRQPRAARATEPPQAPLCNLNIALPEYEATQNLSELVTLEKKYGFVEETGLAKPELIHRADLRLSDIARELGSDWPALAAQLDVPDQDVASIRTECPSDLAQQALLMLRLWMKRAGGRATGNNLEKGLRMINREDIVNKCMFNVELVTDDVEKAVAKVHLDQSGFDTFREELGTPKDTSLKRGNATLDVSYDEQDLMKEAESAEETSSETGSVHEKHTGSEAKGTSKAVPGDSKGSPISAAIGRIVRGSSKEKAAPRMAVEETFEEEPVLKTDSAEVTQHAAVETGPTAPPRDLRKKSKREKSPKPQGPDYSLPRIRDSITPERDFTSTTDAMTVSSIREAADASKEPATDGKLKKEKKKDKKDKKEKSPSPPGPDYTLPRLRDMYTPSDSGATAGYSRSTLPEEDMTPRKDIVKTFSFKRKSKERSLSPDLTRAGKNGSLGADFSTEEQEKRVQKSSEGSLVEKVEKVVKDTPGKIVEIVHIKRQRSSKSPEGTGSFAGKDKQRLPSSEVEIPDMATSLKDMSSDTSDAEKKHKEQKETSPLKQKKKDLKEVTEAVDKDVELSVSDGKSQDTGFLSKMAKLPKKMFPRSGKASASDEEPSSISESSPISKKKSGKFPKSATLPKASEKPSKKPIHEIKSVDVEVDTSKFTSKRSKDALAKDGEDLETSTGDIIKESDGKFFARMSKLPKKMFPRSSKTSSSEDEPSSASESISLSKQKAKKEPKVDATLKKKEKGIKIKQADTQTLPASIDVDISSHSSLPSGVDIGTKKVGKPELPDIEIKKKSKSINMPVPSGVDVAGSVEEAVAGIDISGIKSLPKELDFTVDAKHPDISSDVELSLTSKETTLEWPDKGEGTIETSTPGHGKLTKSGFMTKMAKIPKKMFPHSLKGDVSVEEMSAESIHASVPETQLTLDTDSEMIVSDTLPKELSASIPEGVEGSIELSAQDPSMSSEEGFISKVTRLPRKIFSHDSKDGISVERPSVAMKGVGIEFLQPELQIETSGKGIKVPQTTVDITLPTKKQTADLPDIPEAHIDASLDKLGKSAEPLDVHVNIPKVGGNLGIKANIPDEPQLDFDAQPGKGVSVEIPEGVGGRVEISHPGVPKPSDGGFMAKMAKLPKKIFPHGSKGSVSIEASDAISGAQMKTPGAQLKVGVKGSERTELGADIGLPDKEVAMDFSEGAEGKVALSTPGIGKMSDESFMSKMGKISPKIFPHGTKAGVSVEGVVEGLDAQVKMPEAHLKMDVKSPEKPEVEAVIGLPDLEMAADIPEGIEGKVQLPTPEMGKPSEKGFMSKVAKFPKKMFPHGSKGSVEGTPEIGDIQAKAPEIHLKMDVKGYEKPTIESDVNLPEQKVPDLPEGMEAKVEMSVPEVGKPSDKGFMSKMAKLPKKMFPHGSKGSVSVEGTPEGIGGVQAKMPEAHIKMGVKGPEKPELGDITQPAKKVDVHLPEGVEGKVEISTPEVGKPSDSGFMSKMARFPKKMFPHGSKGSVFIEDAPEVDVQVKMPETHLKMDVKAPERSEVEGDILLTGKTVAVGSPETLEGKVEVSTPEIGRPSDGGFMSKMAKLPKKMFSHGPKGSVSVEGTPESVGEIHVKMPAVHVKAEAEAFEKPELETETALLDKKGAVGMPDGMEGKVELSTPEVGKAPDGGFMSKMGKLPKQILPHGKGSVSIEAPQAITGAQIKVPEAQLNVNIKGPERPELEAEIELPDKEMAVDFSGGVDGKVEVSTPEIGRPSDGGFMSKMVKFPKKLFPHGTKGSVSVEGTPEGIGDVQVRMPEPHIKMDVQGPKKPEVEAVIAFPDAKVSLDLPEGRETKIEVDTPEIGKPSDRGLMSKMATLPKKMFSHGSKEGSVSIGAPEGGDVDLKMPEGHLKMNVTGIEKPDLEAGIAMPDKRVGIDLPEGIEGKIEISGPEIGKPSDRSFMSKVAKLPKKMFPHGSKEGSVSIEEAPEIGDVHAQMPEGHLKMDVTGIEKPVFEADIAMRDKRVGIDLPKGTEEKVEISIPEVGKPLDRGFMSKMAKLPKKMFPHGTKGSVTVGEAPDVASELEVKAPEARLKVGLESPEKPGLETDIQLPQKTLSVDLPQGIYGKVEISGPENGKPSDGGFMSKMAKLPKKMFSHGSKESSISVEGAPEIDIDAKMPEAHLKMDVTGIEKPGLKADIAMPDKKVGIELPEGIEGKVEISGPEIGKPSDRGFMSKMAKLPKKMFPHGSKEGSVSIGAPDVEDVDLKSPEGHLKMDVTGIEKPVLEADIAMPDKRVGIDLPEGIEGKFEISGPEIGKSSDRGLMSKMAKLPQKMFPHGSKEGSVSIGAPEVDFDAKMPEAHLKMDVTGIEKPGLEADIAMPDKKVGIDLPEGIEGKVEISGPEIGKPSNRSFMSKMAKLPKKMFPHGSKEGSVSIGAPDIGDVDLKLPEAHLKMDVTGIEKPVLEADISMPDKRVGIDLPERIEGKVEISGPELGKPSDRGFMSKMAKLPKKMFPHGSKEGSVSIGAPEGGDVDLKLPEGHLKMDVTGIEKPVLEADIATPDKRVGIDLPEGIEGKVEISGPEIGKPSDRGFMSKMAKLPKKMFPHGSKEGSVSIGAPDIGDDDLKLPEGHLKMDVTGIEKPVLEADIAMPDKRVGIDLPEGIEGKVEISSPEIGKPSDRGLMSKMAKLPKKMFPHASKEGSVSIGAPDVGEVDLKLPEGHLKMDVTGIEKPVLEADIAMPDKRVGIGLPEGIEGKFEISGPEIGKPSDRGLMSKMAKLPQKMFSHGSKEGSVSIGAPEVDFDAEMPEAHLQMDVTGIEKAGLDADIAMPDKKVGIDLPEGIEGKVEISGPEIGKPSDRGFMSKMAKLPKKMFPHGSKEGSVSIRAPDIGDDDLKLPEGHLKMDVTGIEKPVLEADIAMPDKRVGIDLPEGIEGKVEISGPEIGEPSDGSFMAKMAKLPKKMFPHGSKEGSISVGAPEVGNVDAKIPEAHLKIGVKGAEMPRLEAESDIGIPDKTVSADFPKGIEGKVEISSPGIGKPSEGGFMSKMAKFPKKMFPHGSKEGSIFIEGVPGVGEVDVKVPEGHLKIDVTGIEKSGLEAGIGISDETVDVDLPESVEGKVEMSAPEIGKQSDKGFMSRMVKLPQKMFSHSSKGSISFEKPPEVGSSVPVKLPETRPKVHLKDHERPEVDVDVSLPEVSAGVPEGIEGKLGITTPELGKPAGSGSMMKIDNVSSKMLLHSPKRKDFVESSSGLVEHVPVKVPEADLGVDVEGFVNTEGDVLRGRKVTMDLTGGIGGDSEIAVAEDGRFMSKMAKIPKKVFPHSSKGEVSLESSLELVRNVQAELPDTHVKLHLKDEQPVAEGGILLPESEVTLDLAGGIEGKVEATTPEVGKSSDTGFVSKISKLPKKLLPHGKKAGTFFEEPIVTAESAHVDIPQPEGTLKIEAKLPTKREASTDIEVPAVTLEGVAGKSEVDVPEIGKASDKGFMSKMAKFPKKMFHHGSKDSGSTDEHTTVAEAIEIKMPEVGVELQTHLKTTKKPEADVSISVYEKEGTVKLPEGSKGGIEISTPKLVGEHVPDGSTQGADIVLPGIERPTMERRETKETPGGVVEVIEVTTHEVSKPSSPGLLSKVSKIPKKIFPRGSKSKSSDEESPSTPKRELKETPGGIVEVIEVTKHDVAKAPEGKRLEQDGTKLLQPASPKTVASNIEGFSPAHMTREIKEVPGGVVEVVRVTKHVVGKLPEDKHSSESSRRMVDPAIPWEAELAKDPSAVVKREVKETPEGHVEVVQVIRREVGDAPLVSDFPGDGSDATVSRRIETTVVDGKPTIIRRLVTTTSDGIQQVTEHIEQGAEELGSTASSLFAKMGEFARGLSSDDPSALTKREVKKLSDGSVEVVSITKRSSSSPGKETTATERLPSSTSGSMHFVESAAGKPTEAKTAILRREISGPETILCTTSVVTSATTSSSSKPELSADVLDKMFGDIGKPKVDDRLKDVLTAEGGYGAKREVTPEEAELLAQLFPEQSSGVAPYPPAGLVPEAAIIPEYRSMMTTGGPPLSPRDPESKEKVLLKLGRALSQDDLDAPSPTRGEAAMTVAGLGEAVDVSDQVEEPAVEKLELARRESKRYSQEFEQDEPLPKAMGLKTKPSEETVVSSTQVKGIHDNGTVKHTVTTVTKTTIIQEVEEPTGAPRPGESETWASDLDTSQVSVSSLPEDERTEPTLSSSATTATADVEALSGPLARTQVEEKEWTETDPDSGEVRHIISKTTHTTVTSVKPGEGAPRGDTMSTSVTRSSKGGRGDSAASAPSSHDEAESLTFCQKKEFFEKLSEQSPLQETLSSRLGSTPSLDTALTRPVVTVKPRPRSESLTSQGEIIEENIVFAERLRLFQNGAQASSSSGANLPHLDLMDQRRQSRDERLQGLPEMTDSLQQQSSEVFTGQQDTDGKSDTRLLVHTSDADKEAFDVCSVQSSEDTGDQQFSRMRVRMPATEEFVSKAPKSSCGLRGEKPSPLRDAYKESLTSQQEGSHIERDEAVAESSHTPSAAADPATSAGRRAGGRERSPLLEASPPEETAYCPAQDISPAQEYPEYLTPDMQVRVGVSPTEVQPAKEKPVRYSESSLESSSEVGLPCPPGQGGIAMAFENVAFAGEDIIDATSSPVEKSSSPTGSRSPYEVVRDTLTEETAEAAHVKEETLYHVGQEVHPRPQSLVAEECNEQIEQQMKSTIFNEAFDHSPKESAPEKKELSEGLLGVGFLTVSGMTARTPESRRGDSDEDEEEWADHVMSKIRGRPIPSTPPASPRAVQSVEVHDEQVTWETPAAEKKDVHRGLVSGVTANEETIVKRDESAAVDDVDAPQPQFQEVIRSTDGKRPQLEHIPSEISDEDLVEREQSPTHITATCRGDRKDSSSDRNSSPDSDGPKACGSHRRSASGVGAIVLESGEPQKGDSSDKYSEESRDQSTQEFDKITEEPEGDMSVIEEEVLVESSTNVFSYDDGNEMGTHLTGTLSPDLDSPPKKKDGDDGSISGKLDAASPVVLRSKSKRREKKSEKRSSRDMDTGHSGSETDHSHYYSFEVTSDSGKTPGPSRPTSSEFDVNILSGQASSEYETCATSQDGEVSGSYATAAASSHDTSFATARSSLSGSSRGSAYSVDSESSGHLGSMEVSEASETIVASAHEELDSDNESERSKSVLREPYDGEIPESVIRGGVEHPFLPSWQPLAKEAAPKLYVPVGARPLTSEAALSQGHSAVPVEPERSCTGWPSASSSSAQSNTSRSTSKTEILNGTGSSASLDGQRRLRYNDDYMASSHEEEQLSVSESSATQSEHTWQTSLETMVDAVEAQRLSCEREFNHRQSTIQNSVSLPFDDAAAEGAEAERSTGNDRATPPFQEVNGPVEVEYVPEYDDLTARTLRPVLEQNISAGQTDMQGSIGTPEASHGEVSFSRVLDEQEDNMELREEGFYAETFQGDLSSEEVESAADVRLLQSRSPCSYNEYCDNVTRYLDSDVCPEVKNISLREHFECPASPEPVDGVDVEDHKPNTSQGHCNDDNGDSSHHINVEAPMCYDKREIKQDCSEGNRCNFLAGTGSYSVQDQPRSETASSSPGRDTADDIKLYTSKCEDYILQMRQTCKYGVGLSNTSDESSYLPEEGMDVENVKLLASRLQEGNVSHQDFPYDLSYEHEYVGDARVEHGDLYTHQEVEEDADDDERTRLHGRRRLSPISDERGSTPDYDTLGGRKTFGKGSEKDDASTSSLMEFERLEAEMASGAKSSSVGSSDSFSGRQQQIRNGTGSEQDSVSVNSLTEFERLEKEIVEAEGVDTRLRGEAVPKLDEIDEGHESQASDPGHETIVYDENCITLSREITVESTVKEECDGTGDNTHLEGILASNEQDVSLYRTERHFLTTRTESGHSVDSVDRQSSASTATQFDADSLRDREIDDSESNFGPETPGWTQKECTDLDSMHDSLHDSERYDSLQEALSRDKDSLQLREPSAEADSLQDDCNDLQDSLYEARDIEWDSVRTEDDPSHNWQQFSSQIRTTELSPTLSRPASSPLVAPVVVERIDTLTWVDQDSTKAVIADEELLDRPQEGPRTDALVSSTDSLEPSSSANTHATYQCDTDSMMSSLNSADESTMVSSTDTLDHEALHFATSGKPLHLESSLQMEGDITEEHLDYVTTDHSHNKRKPAVEGKSADDIEERFRECLLRSATSPVDEEQVEERQMIDEKGNLIVTRTVKRHVTSEPRLHAQTFAGPDAEQRSRDFVASFSSIEPSSEKDECEGFDAAGNTIRVTQHVLVRPIVKTVTFSGPDAQLQMQEYMRNLAGGQQSSAENTPTSDSGVGVCTSLASPPPLVPDPPATAPSSACPGLQRLSGGDHWMEAESALDDSSRPVTATRVITTRTTRTVGPDGREQLVTTTTEEGAGGDEPELRLRRSMQGVLDSFMADPSAPPPHSDEE
ncbi:uncharacterized protein LOC119176963 isoform X7 [Rhipicephalus microplus]|uniref:uncharacterized protein LOC119176963 isoform X7 n=1 Tax=Rhipicephalus microplus TaxID=6941 RepID=UPI003F6D0AC4